MFRKSTVSLSNAYSTAALTHPYAELIDVIPTSLPLSGLAPTELTGPLTLLLQIMLNPLARGHNGEIPARCTTIVRMTVTMTNSRPPTGARPRLRVETLGRSVRVYKPNTNLSKAKSPGLLLESDSGRCLERREIFL